MYKCHACGKQFLGGERIDAVELWREYSELKQTYSQLAEKYGCSPRTIKRKLDAYTPPRGTASPCKVVVVMDTTLWGVLDGCLAMRQPLSYAAVTVVRLHPEEFPLYHDRWTVFNALRQHLAAGLPLSTFVKPDTRPLTYKVSRQQLMCVNPLIDEYSSEECFARAASEFGPIRDFM